MSRLMDWFYRLLGFDSGIDDFPLERGPIDSLPRTDSSPLRRDTGLFRDSSFPSVRVVGPDGDSSVGDSGLFEDHWEKLGNSDFGSAVNPVSEPRVRHATRLRQVVSVFGVRRNEPVLLPDNLKVSRELEVVVEVVPCSDVVQGVDTGTWTFREGRLKIDAFFCAKSEGLSEDAEPLMVSAMKGQKQRVFVGVFDGMGGAGASVLERAENSFTEAYRASRIVRLESFNFVVDKVVNSVLFGRSDILARELATHLQKRLRDYAERWGVGPGASRIRGTLTKTLPTTLACADIRVDESPSGQLLTHIRTMWAGDSRVWVLSTKGLQQLTRDDVDLADPLEQLRQDPPMLNVVSASVDFSLNEVSRSFKGQFLLVAASDGVSGYVRSPGEVEHLLLQAFWRAETSGQPVSRLLRESFAEIAADDVSCVVASVGFSSVTELNHAFESRRIELEKRYAVLEVDVNPEERSRLVDEIWEEERHRYCEFLQGGES